MPGKDKAPSTMIKTNHAAGSHSPMRGRGTKYTRRPPKPPSTAIRFSRRVDKVLSAFGNAVMYPRGVEIKKKGSK